MKRIKLMAALLLIVSTAFAQEIAMAETASAEEQSKIEEFNSRSGIDLRFYPNPTQNTLTVETELRAEKGSIKIYDLSGKLVTDMRVECGCNQIDIDVSNYYNGVYVLTLYDANNKLMNIQRFYKN
jgi:hypothetical protein